MGHSHCRCKAAHQRFQGCDSRLFGSEETGGALALSNTELGQYRRKRSGNSQRRLALKGTLQDGGGAQRPGPEEQEKNAD